MQNNSSLTSYNSAYYSRMEMNKLVGITTINFPKTKQTKISNFIILVYDLYKSIDMI